MPFVACSAYCRSRLRLKCLATRRTGQSGAQHRLGGAEPRFRERCSASAEG
jgi:hypothetical protein